MQDLAENHQCYLTRKQVKTWVIKLGSKLFSYSPIWAPGSTCDKAVCLLVKPGNGTGQKSKIIFTTVALSWQPFMMTFQDYYFFNEVKVLVCSMKFVPGLEWASTVGVVFRQHVNKSGATGSTMNWKKGWQTILCTLTWKWMIIVGESWIKT